MHPCPFCHAEALTLEEAVIRTRRVVLEQIETKPPQWDYVTHEDHDNKSDVFQVTCETCSRVFLFNDDRYATTWPYPPGACEVGHDRTPHGCRKGCEACAWEAAHGAVSWDGCHEPQPLLPRQFAEIMEQFFRRETEA